MSPDVTNDDPPADGRDDLELFRHYAATRSRRVRNELVERHMGLAVHIAGRYSGRGPDDDVRQVAMLGLVKAVDRFDPEHGAAFGSYAGRTIEGEIKRHFRDQGWAVRVPRSAKELHLQVRAAIDDLGQSLGRSPTIDEIGDRLDLDRDDVVRGMAATAASRVGTIDATDDDDVASDRRAVLAADDPGFERRLDAQLVADLLERLPERQREIVRLRFYDGMTQSEIADAVGVSQMHVSRLLRRSFEQMRSWSGLDH